MAAQSISQQQVYPARQSRLDGVMRTAGEITLAYWPHAITVLLGIIVGAALSVPLLTYLGLNEIAKPIFFSLHLICAQIPSHSFYILGHQLGMCARNMGIYSSMFIGGLVFIQSKKRLPGIPWWVWILMILPMAYDGLTQMFGLRESTWELRVLTGALFGFGNMWFVLPFIQRTLLETIANPAQVYTARVQQTAPVLSSTPTVQPFAPVQTPALLSQPELETPLPLSDIGTKNGETEETDENTDATQPQEPSFTPPVVIIEE